jgi:regulator of nucleoside diphosphate kinase
MTQVLPPITVSTLDYERLMALIAKTPTRDFPGARALEAELERANLLEPEQMPRDVVSMRSLVRFEMLPSAEQFELTLCYPSEIDGAPGKVAVTAPMGSAILGLSVGQSMVWPTPGRTEVQVKVLDVSWQPEANGQYLL